MAGFYDRLRAWLSNSKGNVTAIVGLSALPMMAAVGGGIDLTRANNAQNHLQDASDTAVLAAALSPTLSAAEMKVVADRTLRQNISDLNLQAITTELDKPQDINTGAIRFAARAEVPSLFMGLIGIDKIPISTIAKSDATIRNTEIAFVLDSTGSMASNSRMTNLKSSVDAVLASLLDGTGQNSSKTKVAVVPFDTQVKIAPAVNLTYIDYGTASTSQSCTSGTNASLCKVLIDSYDKVCKTAVDIPLCKSRVKLYTKSYTSGSRTYYEARAYSYEISGAGFNLYSFAEVFYTQSGSETMESQGGTLTYVTNLTTYNTKPSGFTTRALSILTYPISYANGYGAASAQSYSTTAYGVSKWVNLPAVAANKEAWTGCVTDRYKGMTAALSYDISASPAVEGTNNSLYPARPCANSALQSVSALSLDIAAARAKVQALSPAGNTNITIGVQWGMEVLSPELPFAGGSAWKTPLYTKYMIVVTDGENTQNRWTSNTAEIDARTALACQAAKDKGIVIYTVRVMDGNSALLKGCASQDSYYYDLTSASQLGDTMKNILKSIRKIKLSQ